MSGEERAARAESLRVRLLSIPSAPVALPLQARYRSNRRREVMRTANPPDCARIGDVAGRNTRKPCQRSDAKFAQVPGPFGNGPGPLRRGDVAAADVPAPATALCAENTVVYDNENGRQRSARGQRCVIRRLACPRRRLASSRRGRSPHHLGRRWPRRALRARTALGHGRLCCFGKGKPQLIDARAGSGSPSCRGRPSAALLGQDTCALTSPTCPPQVAADSRSVRPTALDEQPHTSPHVSRLWPPRVIGTNFQSSLLPHARRRLEESFLRHQL